MRFCGLFGEGVSFNMKRRFLGPAHDTNITLRLKNNRPPLRHTRFLSHPVLSDVDLDFSDDEGGGLGSLSGFLLEREKKWTTSWPAAGTTLRPPARTVLSVMVGAEQAKAFIKNQNRGAKRATIPNGIDDDTLLPFLMALFRTRRVLWLQSRTRRDCKRRLHIPPTDLYSYDVAFSWLEKSDSDMLHRMGSMGVCSGTKNV